VLITWSAHLIGVIEGIRRWAYLQGLVGSTVFYILMTNVLLFFAALAALFAIWFRLRTTKWFILAYVALFIGFYWLDRLYFFQSRDFYRLPFGIGLQILIGLIFWFGLNRKSIKAYFGESND